jgi:cytochrome c
MLTSIRAAGRVRAGPPAAPGKAKALAEKAVAHRRDVGPEKAIADFSSPAGGCMDRELFVVVYGPDNKIVTSAGLPVLARKNATTLKDVEGHPFGQEILDLAKSKGSGWVDDRMTNPATKTIGQKTSWVIRLGDDVLFVGAYKS